MRSVWKRDLPPAVRVVTKNVRGQNEALAGSEGREGIDIAGAKALQFLCFHAARLKSCPDAWYHTRFLRSGRIVSSALFEPTLQWDNEYQP